MVSLGGQALFCRAVILTILVSINTSGCDLLEKTDLGELDVEALRGASLGEFAGEADKAQLASLRAISTPRLPAAIRPDPDVFVRWTLLRYRQEGTTVARQIAEVESFRQLLGGASEDFSVRAQQGYDATSLLAKIKVAEIVCEGLVAPNQRLHSGWESILPASANRIQTNIEWLAQRLLGKAESEISDSYIDDLRAILDTGRSRGEVTLSSYIPVCTAIIVDAEGLLL